jgi:hypothetical protein
MVRRASGSDESMRQARSVKVLDGEKLDGELPGGCEQASSLDRRCRRLSRRVTLDELQQKQGGPQAMTVLKQRKRSGRARPGASGSGKFFHVEVRPARNFISFRVQNLGGNGGIERVAGRRASGSWDTQKWLISKDKAHVVRGVLVPDTADTRELLGSLGSAARHVSGHRFKAKPRRKIPESKKPTPAMRRAQLRNIRKAQAARRRTQEGKR